MGKGSKRQRKPARNPRKTKTRDEDAFPDEDMDDEIDAFHKQRDVVPLDVNATVGDLDDDAEQPVFDFEGGEDSDEDNTDEEDDDDINYDTPPKGLAAKIARQAKYLQQKFGGGDDEMHDDTEEEEEKRTVWGRKKNLYYSADNVDYEIQSSDEDLPMEEEAAVLEIQRERAKALSMEDFGLEGVEQDGSDTDGQEKTVGDIFVGPKAVTELDADANLENGAIESYEAIKKDLNALSKEEQMDVVYSSAPELVGLLSELNEVFNEAEKVKPLISEVSKREGIAKGKMQYFEVKHALLLTYCQAIGFYLLLKSEGHPVRDHPVTTRLVEIKKLLEKMKQIDAISSEHEDIINHDSLNDSANDPLGQNIQLECGPSMTNMSANLNDAFVNETTQLVKDSSSIDSHSKHAKQNKEDIQMGLQSTEMLKVRAALEAKLKQKGLYNLTSIKPEKTQNHVKKPLNGRLETLDDFDDEVHQTAIPHGMSSARLSKLSQLVANKTNHSKFVSGDEDLPKRDDIGERRRKHELRVLARAGADSVDEDKGDDNGGLGPKSMDVDTHGDILESEDEFYKEVKEKRAERLLEKAELYSRTSAVPSMLVEAADGKRQITYQMEKNRGLTRARKKLTKIPRKKYKLKHQKAVIRRKGQVRDIRKPTGPYGGEATGINTGISRSIRFKS